MSLGLAYLAGLLASASPAVGALWPCEPGHSIRYRVFDGDVDSKIRITETVRGPKAPRLCIIDRVVEAPGEAPRKEAFALERLDDRILYAGFTDTMTAFRPPIIKAPLVEGARWTFNRVGYRIEAVGATVETPAGRFTGCVRISEADMKGDEHAGSVVYAPRIGPVIKVTKSTRMVAERVLHVGRAKPKPPKKSWR